MTDAPLKLRPGTLVVFEGIDAAGKSTQIEHMRVEFPDEHYTHSPSGGSALGAEIYKMTESATSMAPLTRQFLHLAAHSEMYEREILPWLAESGVFLDRNWWSTVAYGWYAGGLKYLVEIEDFIRMVRLPTQGINASVVFLFMHEQWRDPHNTVELIDGYACLAERYADAVEPIYIGKVDEVTQQIRRALQLRGLTIPMPGV